jgi:MGT family glycosyltransferase
MVDVALVGENGSMARVLLVDLDAGGNVPPGLGVLQELGRRGHTTHVLADPTVETNAHGVGASFSPWLRPRHFATVEEQTAAIRELESLNPVAMARFARDEIICGPAPLYADEVVETAEAFEPDVVLVGWVLVGGLVGALATGLPVAALIPNAYARPSAPLPQLGTGWDLPRGRLGQLRDAALALGVRRLQGPGLVPVNAALRRHGLEPTEDLFSLVDRCARVLVLTSPSFDLPFADLPPNVRYVGPSLEDPAVARDDGQWRVPGDDPLVLVGMSSVYQDQSGALTRVARALGRLPVRGLVTTGGGIDPAEIDAPANVRVVRWAPHQEVLREASAVVTHCGHGTAIKALAAGTPMVCMPQGRDQKDVALRVRRLGAGVTIGKRTSVDGIARAVEQVLGRRGHGEAAARFALVLEAERQHYPGGADEVEELVRARG